MECGGGGFTTQATGEAVGGMPPSELPQGQFGSGFQAGEMPMEQMGAPQDAYYAGAGYQQGDGSDGGWGMPGAMLNAAGMPGMDGDELNDDYNEGGISVPQSMPEGPCVALPALSLRQPFASLVLYGVKQLEARNRPALKQLSGPLALHVSHREEPFHSPLVSTAIAILRRRYADDAISSLFTLPQTHAQGHGSIVGLVDVEATWPADLFNEIEQTQLTEQAVFPVSGTFITQLRNPRWLKYPVRTSGSNKLWTAQIPLDALPDGTEIDGHGNLVCTALREKPPLYQPGSAAPLMGESDDLGLGLLGGDMVRQLQSADGMGEKEKKMKKLQKALRQIDELKAKQASGVVLEKTQEGKIEREEELRTELAQLMQEPDGEDGL